MLINLSDVLSDQHKTAEWCYEPRTWSKNTENEQW